MIQQLEFPLPVFNTTEILSFLERTLGRKIELIFRKRKNHLIEFWRKSRTLWVVELSEIFLYATWRDLEALAQYLRNPCRATSRPLREFGSRVGAIRPSAYPKSLRVEGSHFHLLRQFEAVSEQMRICKNDVQITWGLGRNRRRRKSIQLGSYDPEWKLIRIHPCLDHAKVPDYVMNRIIYHELLHHTLSDGGRVLDGLGHGRVFRHREREFPQFHEAEAWEKANFRFLVRNLNVIQP